MVNTDILPGYQTDHFVPLDDSIFIEELSKVFEIEIAQPMDSIKKKWEVLKLSIRNYTLKYAAMKQKSVNNKLGALECKLKEPEEKLHQVSIVMDLEDHILGLRLKKRYK